VEIRFTDEVVTVDHARAPRRSVRASAGLGLANLDERARLATGRGIAIREAKGRFAVDVPLGPG
jgi:hypothetical protein